MFKFRRHSKCIFCFVFIPKFCTADPSTPIFWLHFFFLFTTCQGRILPPQHIWHLCCPHLPFFSLSLFLDDFSDFDFFFFCNMPPCAGGKRGPVRCEDLQIDAWKVSHLGEDSPRKWGDRSRCSRTIMFGCLFDLLPPPANGALQKPNDKTSMGLCFRRPVRLNHH